MTTQELFNIELAEFAGKLAPDGFRQVGSGIFLGPCIEEWNTWIGYVDEGGANRRLALSLCNSHFINVKAASMKAYESTYNKVRRIRHHYPMFLAHDRDVDKFLLGDENQTIARDSSLDRLVSKITKTYVPFLNSCRSFESCLRNLERFSKGLPMYPTTRLVLLKLLDLRAEFDYFADEWITSLEGQATLELDREFVKLLRDQSSEGN